MSAVYQSLRKVAQQQLEEQGFKFEPAAQKIKTESPNSLKYSLRRHHSSNSLMKASSNPSSESPSATTVDEEKSAPQESSKENDLLDPSKRKAMEKRFDEIQKEIDALSADTSPGAQADRLALRAERTQIAKWLCDPNNRSHKDTVSHKDVEPKSPVDALIAHYKECVSEWDDYNNQIDKRKYDDAAGRNILIGLRTKAFNNMNATRDKILKIDPSWAFS